MITDDESAMRLYTAADYWSMLVITGVFVLYAVVVCKLFKKYIK